MQMLSSSWQDLTDGQGPEARRPEAVIRPLVLEKKKRSTPGVDLAS
jgi:hypothetical protein